MSEPRGKQTEKQALADTCRAQQVIEDLFDNESFCSGQRTTCDQVADAIQAARDEGRPLDDATVAQLEGAFADMAAHSPAAKGILEKIDSEADSASFANAGERALHKMLRMRELFNINSQVAEEARRRFSTSMNAGGLKAPQIDIDMDKGTKVETREWRTSFDGMRYESINGAIWGDEDVECYCMTGKDPATGEEHEVMMAIPSKDMPADDTEARRKKAAADKLREMWGECSARAAANVPLDFKTAMDRMPEAQRASFMRVIEEISNNPGGAVSDEHMETMKEVALAMSNCPPDLAARMPISDALTATCKANVNKAMSRLADGDDVDTACRLAEADEGDYEAPPDKIVERFCESIRLGLTPSKDDCLYFLQAFQTLKADHNFSADVYSDTYKAFCDNWDQSLTRVDAWIKDNPRSDDESETTWNNRRSVYHATKLAHGWMSLKPTTEPAFSAPPGTNAYEMTEEDKLMLATFIHKHGSEADGVLAFMREHKGPAMATPNDTRKSHEDVLKTILVSCRQFADPTFTPDKETLMTFYQLFSKCAEDGEMKEYRLFKSCRDTVETQMSKSDMHRIKKGKFDSCLFYMRQLSKCFLAEKDKIKETLNKKADRYFESGTRVHSKITAINAVMDKHPDIKPMLALKCEELGRTSPDGKVSLAQAALAVAEDLPFDQAKQLIEAAGGIVDDIKNADKYKDAALVAPIARQKDSSPTEADKMQKALMSMMPAGSSQLCVFSSDGETQHDFSGLTKEEKIKKTAEIADSLTKVTEPTVVRLDPPTVPADSIRLVADEPIDHFERLGLSKDRPIVTRNSDGSQRVIPHPLTEGEKARMILAEQQGGAAWQEARDAIIGCRHGNYPPDWHDQIIQRQLFATSTPSAPPPVSETKFEGLKGGFLKSKRKASKSPPPSTVRFSGEGTEFKPKGDKARLIAETDRAYKDLIEAPPHIITKLAGGKTADIEGIAQHLSVSYEAVVAARKLMTVKADRAIEGKNLDGQATPLEYVQMPDGSLKAGRPKNTKGMNVIELNKDGAFEKGPLCSKCGIPGCNCAATLAATRKRFSEDGIHPDWAEHLPPVEDMIDEHGKTWPDWMSYIPKKYHDLVGVDDCKLHSMALKHVPQEHPFHAKWKAAKSADATTDQLMADYRAGKPSPSKVALSAFGEFIESKLSIIVQSKGSHKLKWARLFDYNFEPITMDGKSCFISSDTTDFTSWQTPDAIRHLEIKDFVLSLHSAKYRPKLPIDNREFLERCMIAGAKAEDTFIERKLAEKEDERRRIELEELKANDAANDLKEAEEERAAREAFKQSEVYKQEQHARNQKAKANEKASKAERKAEAERKDKERVDKIAAEKIAAKQKQADECIESGIKYGQEHWDAGDRKAARKRLGVANTKHFANASPSGQQRSKDKKAAWDAIETAEREASRPPPPPPPTLEQQLAIIADDTPNVSPEPSPPPPPPPRESTSQRKARKKREREAREHILKFKLKKAVNRYLCAVRSRLEAQRAVAAEAAKEAREAREHAERQREIAEQQRILDEINSRDRTERTNRAIQRQAAEQSARVAGKGKGRGGRGLGDGRGGSSRDPRNAIRLTPVRTVNVNGGDAGIVFTNKPPKPPVPASYETFTGDANSYETMRKSKATAAAAGPSTAPLPPSSDDDSCIICMDRVRTHTTIPCGHLKFCGECAAKMTREGRQKCPECSTTLNPAQKFMKVFG